MANMYITTMSLNLTFPNQDLLVTFNFYLFRQRFIRILQSSCCVAVTRVRWCVAEVYVHKSGDWSGWVEGCEVA